MAGRSYAENKQFNQRRKGIMKKANDLRKLCNVNVAVFIEDDDDHKWYLYRSKPNWPAGTEIKGAHTLLPDDFTTLREAALKISTAPAEDSTAHSSLSSDDQFSEEPEDQEASPPLPQIPSWNEMSEISTMDNMCQAQLQPNTWANIIMDDPTWRQGGHNESFAGHNAVAAAAAAGLPDVVQQYQTGTGGLGIAGHPALRRRKGDKITKPRSRSRSRSTHSNRLHQMYNN